MAYYSKEERIDMIFVYGESGECMRQAVRMYRNRFPDRVCPSRSAYSEVVRVFQETGSVDKKKRIRAKRATNERNETNILAAVALNPHVSTRQLERESGISQSSIVRILHTNKFHPFHVSLHQELHGTDFENRRRFCEWGLLKLQNDDTFFKKVLFTDEASFTNHGQVNLRNSHYWSVENPRWLREVAKQRPWSINVWCGIVNNQIIGPYFIDGTLNGEKYIRFLTDILPILLEDIPLHVRQALWYQHDGCPAHSTCAVTAILNRKFGNRWIGRMGNHKYPPRSPDFTPLDFFLWGKLKADVYHTAPTTKEDMKERIQRACAAIDQDMIQRVTQSMGERFRQCLAVDGHHFEHL